MNDINPDVIIQQVLKSIDYMINNAIKKTTQNYSGIVVSNNNNGKWNVQYNGETHPIFYYGDSTPTIGDVVQVFVPQGNQNLACFY